MTVMKEKVATRMAAHDSMKSKWVLPANQTEPLKILLGSITAKQHFQGSSDPNPHRNLCVNYNRDCESNIRAWPHKCFSGLMVKHSHKSYQNKSCRKSYQRSCKWRNQLHINAYQFRMGCHKVFCNVCSRCPNTFVQVFIWTWIVQPRYLQHFMVLSGGEHKSESLKCPDISQNALEDSTAVALLSCWWGVGVQHVKRRLSSCRNDLLITVFQQD